VSEVSKFQAETDLSRFGQLFDCRAAAEFVRCTTGWLAQRRINKLSPRYMRVGGKISYAESALVEFLAQSQVHPGESSAEQPKPLLIKRTEQRRRGRPRKVVKQK